MRNNVLVKLSGDCIDLNNSRLFTKFLEPLAHQNHMVIVPGGGTGITQALQAAGVPSPAKFMELGRELRTLEERQIARDVLERHQAYVQDFLDAKHVHCAVEIPVLYCGSVMCHVNGDVYVQAMYHGFDNIYVVTTPDRYHAKILKFKDTPKIQVVNTDGPWPNEKILKHFGTEETCPS